MPLKACEAVLREGRLAKVRELTNAEFPLFLQAVPALQVFADMQKIMTAKQEGIIAPMPPSNPNALDPLWELLAAITVIQEESGEQYPATVEMLRGLPLADGMALVLALGEIVPK